MLKKRLAKRSLKKLISVLILSFLFISSTSQAESNYWKDQKYVSLISKLKEMDFSEETINSTFGSSQVKFYPNIIKKFKTAKVPNLAAVDSELLSSGSITRGLEFIKRNKKALENVEKERGVEKETIVAILRIESSFGQITGKYQAFGILNSIVFYSESDSNRSKWAKKQIIALLTLCRALGDNPLDKKSSWAGAIGIPQFISTSYLDFGVDGNKDGQVNLFELEDTFHSVANYLIKNNWKKDNLGAIYSYNHSLNYVMGVKAYAEKLKNKEGLNF